MTTQSVATQPAPYEGISEDLKRARAHAALAATHTSHEPDPYERIHARCKGLQDVLTLASMEKDQDTLQPHVWQSLFYFMEQVTDDIARDAELLRVQGYELWKEGRGKRSEQ